jgi:hypothetical protein
MNSWAAKLQTSAIYIFYCTDISNGGGKEANVR